jgi:hypothetical protein
VRLPNPEQGGIPGGICLGFIQKRHDLRDGRECRRGMERYVASPMPRRGIFGDVVPSRYVAIRQPSLKIGLNFVTPGAPTDAAGPRHAITSSSSSAGTGDRSGRPRKMVFQIRKACCAG